MEVFTTAPSLIVRGSKPREGRAGNVVGVAGHADPCDGDDDDGDNENGGYHVGYERFMSSSIIHTKN